jgi:hypothetical protein
LHSSARLASAVSAQLQRGVLCCNGLHKCCNALRAYGQRVLQLLRLDRERAVRVVRQEVHVARDNLRPPHAERFAHLRKRMRHSAPGSSRAPTPRSPYDLVRRVGVAHQQRTQMPTQARTFASARGPLTAQVARAHGRGRNRPRPICTGTGGQEPAEVGTSWIAAWSMYAVEIFLPVKARFRVRLRTT